MLKDFVPQDADRPTSNPLPPQSEAFADYLNASSAQQVLESVAKEVPNFGTEQVHHLSLLYAKYGSSCKLYSHADSYHTLCSTDAIFLSLGGWGGWISQESSF